MNHSTEATYLVWLHDKPVGALHQRGDHTRFVLHEEYQSDPFRPVLGLVFEDDLSRRHAAHMRLPPWFSNLLPEGRLRDWIAADRGVKVDREMELLAQVGHDLPGAVRVLPSEDPVPEPWWDQNTSSAQESIGLSGPSGWRFSLAGVTLKFSMVATGQRLTLPAHGEGGDWIVKLPDAKFPDVPRNEHAMMRLAALCGLDTPPVRLVHRDDLIGIPNHLWPNAEEWAYAVGRFDRDANRRPVHIEDLAQVRNFYPQQKYYGSFETVARLIYRRRDIPALQEFARRLAFNILIGNGDAHLKNWSLIYRDRRIPTLSPAYDLVATTPYQDRLEDLEDLGLKFAGTRQFGRITLDSFTRLDTKLDASAQLADHVADLAEKVRSHWPQVADLLADSAHLRASIGSNIDSGFGPLTSRAD